MLLNLADSKWWKARKCATRGDWKTTEMCADLKNKKGKVGSQTLRSINDVEIGCRHSHCCRCGCLLPPPAADVLSSYDSVQLPHVAVCLLPTDRHTHTYTHTHKQKHREHR